MSPARIARVVAPAALALLQSGAFLYVYCRATGETSMPVAPHLTLVVFLVGTAYGHALILSTIRRGWLRRVVLAGVSFLMFGTVLVFYAVTLVCLYGFRDLATRAMVAGYLGQVPSMIRALPVEHTTVVLAGVASVAFLVGYSFLVGWCLEGLAGFSASPSGGRARTSVTRLVLQLGAPAAFALLVAARNRWFLDNLEPMTRSVWNESLLARRVQVQAFGKSNLRDKELESQYPTSPLGNRKNVVLIVIDALRADVLQPYGGPLRDMPFMDSLVRLGGVRQFPRVYATCSFTLCGLASLLGSRPAHLVQPDDFVLPKLLKRQGYDLRYLLSGDHQHYLNLKAYYGDDIDFYLDGRDIDAQHSTDDLVVFKQLSRLPAATAVANPQFMLLWLMSVHALGQRNPLFRRELPDRVTIMDAPDLARKSVEAYRNNYHNGVLQADWVLKEIWGWLQRNGYLDSSIVVITGDHGESLGERGRLGHTRSLQNSELHVPLWIHEPSGRLKTRDFVFQTDVAPTVLDLLGLPVPASWVGASLLSESTNEWHPIYLMNGGSQYGLIRYHEGGITKYLVDTLFGYERVYDLISDPAEEHDLATNIPYETLLEFRRHLMRTFGPVLPNIAPDGSAPNR